MKKTAPQKPEKTAPVSGIEEIRKNIKKQELQTIILKKIIEKNKESK